MPTFCWTSVTVGAIMFFMGQAAQRIRMTEDEYLAFERASDERHEYADGEIFAMAGSSRKHSRIQARFIRLLGNALDGGRCDVYTSELRIYIPLTGRYVYPDCSVVCGPEMMKDDERDILLNPRVIVEVLSPSTQDYDRVDKFAHYKTIPSFVQYVLASQDKPFVEVFTRQLDGSWTCVSYGAGEKIVLPALECEIDVDQVYANVFDDVAA